MANRLFPVILIILFFCNSNSSPATAAILMDDAANTHTAPMINNPSNRSNNNPVLGSSGDLLMGDFLDSSLNGGGNGGSSSRAVGGIGGGGGDSFYNTDDLKGLEIDAVDDDDFSFFDSGDILGGGASKQIATTMSSSSAPVAAGVGSVTSTNSETSASAAIAQFTSSNSSPSYPIDMGLSPAAIAVASVSATSTNPLPNASSSSSSTKQQQQQPQQRFNHQVMNNNNAMFGISPSPLAMSPLPTHSASFTPFASAATPAAVTPFYSGVPTPMGPLSPAAAAADNQDEPLPSITETSLETIVVATATSLSSVAAATSTSSVTAITATEFNLNGNAWCGVSKATRRFLLPSQIIEDDLDAFRSINLLPKKWVPFQFPLDNTVSHQLDANIDVSGALKMRHPLAHLVKKYGKRGRWSYSLSSSTSSSIPSSTKSNTGNVSRGLTGKRKADSDHVSGDIHPPPLKKSVTSAPSSSESSSSSSSPNSSSSSTQDDLNIRSKPSSASHCSKTTAATITTSPSFLKNHTVSPPPASIPPIRILSIENSAIFSMILSSSSSLLMSASSLRKTSSFSSFLDCLAPYSSFKVFTDQASECIQRYSSSSTAGISFSSPSSALLPSSVSSSPTTNILDIVFERKKMLDSPALSYKRRMVDELAIYLVLQGSVYSLKFDLYADTQEKESDCENLESDALFRDLKSLEVVRAIMEETVCRGNIATTAATTPDATTPGVYTAVGSADMTGSPDVISGASASGGADQSSLPIQLKGPLTLQQFFDSQGK